VFVGLCERGTVCLVFPVRGGFESLRVLVREGLCMRVFFEVSVSLCCDSGMICAQCLVLIGFILTLLIMVNCFY